MFLKAIFTGFAVAALALAQGGGMGGGGSTGGRGEQNGTPPAGSMGMKIPPKTKGEEIADRLKLNKDQKVQVESLLNSTLKEADPLIQELLQARNVYATALVNGKSGADLDTLAKALGEAQFAMTGVEVRAFQKIVELLKPNQLAKAPEAFDIMAGIFLPQSGGGMGRGGGRGAGRGGR
jgi:hypothetical protein